MPCSRSRKPVRRSCRKIPNSSAGLSEHRKIEKALVDSEAKYRALVENITEVIFTLNDHDLITYVSPAIRNLTGYAPPT